MKKIEINKEKEKVISGFLKLIEAKMNGEEAVWEFGGYVTTTEMIPDNFMDLSISQLIQIMKRAAVLEQMGGRTDSEYYKSSGRR